MPWRQSSAGRAAIAAKPVVQMTALSSVGILLPLEASREEARRAHLLHRGMDAVEEGLGAGDVGAVPGQASMSARRAQLHTAYQAWEPGKTPGPVWDAGDIEDGGEHPRLYGLLPRTACQQSDVIFLPDPSGAGISGCMQEPNHL